MSFHKRRNYSYSILVPPADLAVSLDDMKTHLKIPLATITFDAEITEFIKAATIIAEQATGRTFIDTTFRTFRDFFSCCFQLRRAKATSIVQIQYNVKEILTIVPVTTYFLTDSNEFGEVHLQDKELWPTDNDDIDQSILIDFIAGFGPTSADVPANIQQAIKMIVANMWANRGDCCDACLPNMALMLLNQSKIIEFSIKTRCE